MVAPVPVDPKSACKVRERWLIRCCERGFTVSKLGDPTQTGGSGRNTHVRVARLIPRSPEYFNCTCCPIAAQLHSSSFGENRTGAGE